MTDFIIQQTSSTLMFYPKPYFLILFFLYYVYSMKHWCLVCDTWNVTHCNFAHNQSEEEKYIHPCEARDLLIERPPVLRPAWAWRPESLTLAGGDGAPGGEGAPGGMRGGERPNPLSILQTGAFTWARYVNVDRGRCNTPREWSALWVKFYTGENPPNASYNII